MSEEVRWGKCARCHRLMIIRKEGQKYGPTCTRNIAAFAAGTDPQKSLYKPEDHLRSIGADE